MPTDKQIVLGISIIERICSVLSILGCLFIIVTFCLSSAFHKPINRLVFYASFGNLFCNVATLISTSYVDYPASAGCQTQAFLIQMFMPADALWTLAMAANVYLTFYFRYDTRRLQRIEPIYLTCCYGIPAIPAIAYLFVKNNAGYRVYGDARLWCWISNEWNIWRITSFYGPIWLVIIVTFFIYGRAGRTIYERRKQLLKFDSSTIASHHAEAAAENTKVTEVTVTTERTTVVSETEHRRSDPTTIVIPNIQDPAATYSINIFADSHSANETTDRPGAKRPARVPRRPKEKSVRARADNAAWQYTKCSILFFTAMLITWIPSSANRVQSLIYGQSSVPLEFMSAFVLPLQGFWNAVIYCSTSWVACRNFASDVKFGRRPNVTEIVGRSHPTTDSEAGEMHQLEQVKSSHRAGRHHESESTASLACSSGTNPSSWSP